MHASMDGHQPMMMRIAYILFISERQMMNLHVATTMDVKNEWVVEREDRAGQWRRNKLIMLRRSRSRESSSKQSAPKTRTGTVKGEGGMGEHRREQIDKKKTECAEEEEEEKREEG